ncbi:MAG: acyl-CoA desaturase [Pseudomonadota bacterium]
MTQHCDDYSNPRVEFPGATGDAVSGVVRADPKKILWLAPMYLFGTVGSASTATPGAIALFLLFTGLTLCLGHSLGMHRRLIHRAFDCPKWLEYTMIHLGTIVGISGPLTLLRTHDTRDWAQRQSQCHDYFASTPPWYRDFWWQVFCSLELRDPPEVRIEKEIEDDAFIQFMERTWMWQQLPWAVLFFAIGGWGWVFWGICSRVAISVFGHWIIGYFAHNTGDQHWHVDGAAVQGFNVPFTALLTMGECWHNNHHAYPGSAKLGIHKGEWDPGWWVLMVWQRLGLASNFNEPDNMPLRRELIMLSDVEDEQNRAHGHH